jgi:hypothetical protein
MPVDVVMPVPCHDDLGGSCGHARIGLCALARRQRLGILPGLLDGLRDGARQRRNGRSLRDSSVTSLAVGPT